MRFRFLFFTLMTLTLVLAACGDGGGGDDVTEPVKIFFKAFEEMDAEKAAATVCKEYRDDVETGLEMIFGFVELGGEEAKIEIVDMKLGVEEETENEAVVMVTSGKIKVTVLGEVQEQDITESGEAIKVIKESDKWVICDASLAEGFTP